MDSNVADQSNSSAKRIMLSATWQCDHVDKGGPIGIHDFGTLATSILYVVFDYI